MGSGTFQGGSYMPEKKIRSIVPPFFPSNSFSLSLILFGVFLLSSPQSISL